VSEGAPLHIEPGFLTVLARKEGQVRNEVRELIEKRFDEGGIEIPFPHRTLYTGAVTEPLPTRIVDTERQPGRAEEIGPGTNPEGP